jgi:hypothetical protein
VLAENLDALKCWWLGVFIAPTTKVVVGEGCCRRVHRTVWCATGHCPVHQPRHPTVGFRPLELLTSGPPDSTVHCPVRHRTPTLTLRAQSRTVHCSCSCCRRPLTLVVVAPLGTPDSPVNYSGVAPRIPEGGKFGVDLPGAPDTVRCARPGQPSVVFCSFCLNPFLDFLLVCVEPLASVELIF